MPKGPKGEKRPADVIGAAVMVMKIATGEIEERTAKAAKKRAGTKGARQRALKLSPEQKSKIARQAAMARL